MKITIEEIKKGIEKGEVNRIYYSAQTLWWTHSGDDLKEATEIGHKIKDEKHLKFLANPNIPDDKKSRLDSLFKMTKKMKHQVPCDMEGSPLLQVVGKECIKFIEVAESQPEHFGKHKLDAFIMAHHQNCEGKCFHNWDEINEKIDGSMSNG